MLNLCLVMALLSPAGGPVGDETAERLLADIGQLRVRRLADLRDLYAITHHRAERAEVAYDLARTLLDRSRSLQADAQLATLEERRSRLAEEANSAEREALALFDEVIALPPNEGLGDVWVEHREDALWSQAEIYGERGDDTMALRRLRQIERDARAPADRAFAAERQGRVYLAGTDVDRQYIEKAHAAFWRATRASDARVRPWVGYGETAAQLGDIETALAAFAHVLRVAPDDGRYAGVRRSATTGLAQLLAERADYSEARPFLEALGPSAAAVRVALGEAYDRREQPAEALAAYVVALDEASPTERADLLLSALAAARRAIRRDVVVALAQANAALLDDDSVPGRVDAVESALRAVLVDVFDTRDQWTLAQENALFDTYLDHFDDRAFAPTVIYQRGLRRSDDEKPCAAHLADARSFMAAFDHARADGALAREAGFNAVRSLALCRPAPSGDRPEPMPADGRLIEFAERYVARFDTGEESGRVRVISGVARLARGDGSGARADFEAALAIDGGHIRDAALGLMDALAVVDDLPALEAHGLTMKADPRLDAALRARGYRQAETAAYLHAQRSEAATRPRALEGVVDRYPDGALRSAALLEAGQLYASSGRAQQAISGLLRVIALDPDGRDGQRARRTAGELRQRQGRFAEGARFLEAWLIRAASAPNADRPPESVRDDVRWRLVRLHRALGDPVAAWRCEAVGLAAEAADRLRAERAIERMQFGDLQGARALAAGLAESDALDTTLAVIRDCRAEDRATFTERYSSLDRRSSALRIAAVAACGARVIEAQIARLPTPGDDPTAEAHAAEQLYPVIDELAAAMQALGAPLEFGLGLAASAEVLAAFANAVHRMDGRDDSRDAIEVARLAAQDARDRWRMAEALRARIEGGEGRIRLDGPVGLHMGRALRRIIDGLPGEPAPADASSAGAQGSRDGGAG